MKFNPDNPLHAALDSINVNYGTGALREVRYNPSRQLGSYVTICQYGTRSYIWHFVRGRVYACGTSRKVQTCKP